jgi:predicted DNA-binding transcriptional regulator AlpA
MGRIMVACRPSDGVPSAHKGWTLMASTSALSEPGHSEIHAEEPTRDLISIPETARRIGLHADTLYRLCRMGQFSPAIHIGARWRVSVPRLERYLHGEDERS